MLCVVCLIYALCTFMCVNLHACMYRFLSSIVMHLGHEDVELGVQVFSTEGGWEVEAEIYTPSLQKSNLL